MEFYIYALRAENEECPFYIGKSFIGSRRLYEHNIRANSGDKYLVYNKIRKLKKDNVKFFEERIIVTKNESIAFEMEKYLIAHYGRRDLKTGILCNLTDGGEGCVGQKMSEESRQKMSLAKKGNKINVGKKRPDMIERFSKEISQYDKDGNWVATFSSAKKAEKETRISRKMISDCLNEKARITSFKDTYFTWRYGSSKEKVIIREKKSKSIAILQYLKGGTFIKEFKSATEAAKTLNLSQTSISSACRGEQKTSGGYVWKFKD
jgi:hypothetical protein